jgi:prolipoprotein diacylglyceryl transferase
MILASIPSPSVSGIHLGPLFLHFYGLMYVVGIALAVAITTRRWAAVGGDRELVYDVLLWGVPAGIIGGRLYFDVTTPFDITPHTWWGPLAVWNGGLGIWGGIAAGGAVGVWRVRRAGASAGEFMNAVAPALLVAQAIGRIGNYFNQELFGKPSTLPWAVEISYAARLDQKIPAVDLKYSTFQPSFLYEMIFDLAWAALLVWLGHHRRIRPQGLFALYVAGYSGYRIFEETIRIDSSAYFLGLRLNFFVAIVMTAAGLAWFVLVQRRGRRADNTTDRYLDSISSLWRTWNPRESARAGPRTWCCALIPSWPICWLRSRRWRAVRCPTWPGRRSPRWSRRAAATSGSALCWKTTWPGTSGCWTCCGTTSHDRAQDRSWSRARHDRAGRRRPRGDRGPGPRHRHRRRARPNGRRRGAGRASRSRAGTNRAARGRTAGHTAA